MRNHSVASRACAMPADEDALPPEGARRFYLDEPGATRRAWASRRNPLYPMVRRPLVGAGLGLGVLLALLGAGALTMTGLSRELLLALPGLGVLLFIYLYTLGGRPFVEVGEGALTVRRRARGRTERLAWKDLERVAVRRGAVVLHRRARYAPVRLSLNNAPEATARALTDRLTRAAARHGVPVSS